MIDYVPYFQFVESASSLVDAYNDKKKFIDLFYQYAISDQSYPFSCKLFDETPFQVDLANEMGRELFVHGFIEPSVTNYFWKNIEPGDGFIDCGAHMGYYSKLASKLVGSNGFVFAFEPNPVICELFQKNNSSSHNIKLSKKALSGDGQLKKLNCFGNNLSPYNCITGESRIISEQAIEPSLVIDVESVKLSDVINQLLLQIDQEKKIWIKLDIEGSELDVLKSSIDTIASKNCMLVFEGGLNFRNDKEITSLLVDNFFEVFLFDGFNLIPIPQDEYKQKKCRYFLAKKH